MVTFKFEDNLVVFEQNNQKYEMDLYNFLDYAQEYNQSEFIADWYEICDFIKFLADSGDFRELINLCFNLHNSDMNSEYFVVDSDYEVETFDGLREFGDLFDIGGIIDELVMMENIEDYSEKLEGD